MKNIELSVDSMKLLMEISMRKSILSTFTINKDENKSTEVKKQDENSDYDIKDKEENLQNITNSKNKEQEFDDEKEVSSSSDDEKEVSNSSDDNSSSEYSLITSRSKSPRKNFNEERTLKEGPFVKRSFFGSLDPDFSSKAAKESSKKQNIPKTASQPSSLNPQAQPFIYRKKPNNIFATNPPSSSSPHSKPNPFQRSTEAKPCNKPNPFSNPVKSTNNPFSTQSAVSHPNPFAKTHDKCVNHLNENDTAKVAASDKPPKSTNPFTRTVVVDYNRKNPFAGK